MYPQRCLVNTFTLVLSLGMVFFTQLSHGAETTAAINPKKKLAAELCAELEIEKQVQKLLVGNELIFRKPPTENNPDMQAKIKNMYQEAEANYKKLEPQIEKMVLNEVQDKFVTIFSEAEIKYLITLSKYPPAKKLRTFLTSQSYEDTVTITFNEAIKVFDSLNLRVIALKNESAKKASLKK